MTATSKASSRWERSRYHRAQTTNKLMVSSKLRMPDGHKPTASLLITLSDYRSAKVTGVTRLRPPDSVNQLWPELAISRCLLLPLLGERVGVRAGVSP